MDMNLSKIQEIVKDRGAWRAAIQGVTELDTDQWQKNNSNNKLSTQTTRDFKEILSSWKPKNVDLNNHIYADGDCSHEIKRRLLLGRKVMTNLDSIFKSRDITLPTKVHLVKAMVFPVVMYGCEELDREESWALKNWCFWTVVLEKTLESPMDCKEIHPVHPKGNQSWVIIGRTDAEAETPVLWPPHAKSWLIWKDPDAGRDWGQEEKGTTGDEMVGWHHWLDGHEFEWTPGVGDGQGGLACCNSWGRKESDMTEPLNWTESSCWDFPGGPVSPFQCRRHKFYPWCGN